MRLLTLIILAAALAGCASGQYRNRVMKNAAGKDETYFFAYGKFCGPNYPALKEGEKLSDRWPPQDDLDSVCYAHDQCYAITFGDNDRCDRALRVTLNKHSTKLKADGCWGLAGDMIDAFFAKNYSKGESKSETIATQLTHSTTGLFFAGLLQALRSPLNLFSKPAVEGTCNIESTSNPRRLISDFQDAYQSGFLVEKTSPINIPVPE